MKKLSFLSFLMTFFFLLVAFTPPQYKAASMPILVPAGTAIEVVLNQHLSFDNCLPQTQILLKTYRSHSIAKREVIRVGSVVHGQIRAIEYARNGHCAKVFIVVQSVVAIDNNHLRLSPQEFIFYLERKKGVTEVKNAANSFVAQTLDDIEIQA